MNIEVYAGNLIAGGAVSVAASFFRELPNVAKGSFDGVQWCCSISREVAGSMGETALGRLRKLGSVSVRTDRRGLRVQGVQPDVRLVLFGPEFGLPPSRRGVCGFADRTVIPGPSQLTVPSALVRGIKRHRLRHYQGYIVQTYAAATELRTALETSKPVLVVPNSVDSIFFDPTQWAPVVLPPRHPGVVRLFYPAFGYVHKNHRFLPVFTRLALEQLGVRVEVLVTLPDEQYVSLGLAESHSMVNLGVLTTAECAWVLSQSDAMIFPSLLETFSSAPLEAIAMGVPVLASDISSIQNSVGGHTLAFDANDALSAVHQLRNLLQDENARRTRCRLAQDWLAGQPDATERVRRMLNFAVEVCK